MDSWRREFEGEVVYARRKGDRYLGIYKTTVGEQRATLLAAGGRYPRWSPDGSRIAYLLDRDVWVMNADGADPRRLASAEDPPHAVGFHPGGREVLFAVTNEIRAVTLDGGTPRVLYRDRKVLLALDMCRRDDRLMVVFLERPGYHYLRACDLTGGSSRVISSGCSANLSPDGELLTDLNGTHLSIAVRRWETGEFVRTIPGPAGYEFDNEIWSNDPDWVALQTQFKIITDTNTAPPTVRMERREDIFLTCATTSRVIRVTRLGDCVRPDLFIRRRR